RAWEVDNGSALFDLGTQSSFAGGDRCHSRVGSASGVLVPGVPGELLEPGGRLAHGIRLLRVAAPWSGMLSSACLSQGCAGYGFRLTVARMAPTDPHRPPHYPPTHRLAIRELRAAGGRTLAQTARVFQVSPLTGQNLGGFHFPQGGAENSEASDKIAD